MNLETRIPTEILSEIFHLLCDEPIALGELENNSCRDDFPWAVGQVCRRWRSAFLSHPPLWTSLSLCSPLQDPSAAYIAEINRRSAIYLERSGQLPLTIAISTENSNMTTIWKMLLSCSNRWRKADIVLPSAGSFIDDALLECRSRIPILESLTICKSGLKGKGCYNEFEIAPHLTELNLELYEGWIVTWMFPWAQLTKLRLTLYHITKGFASGDELRTFLLQLQNVEDLQFTMPNLSTSLAAFKFPPVRLTRLRFLKLSVAVSVVFSWLELPLLEHLWLDYQYVISDVPDACRKEISSLIDRSSCCIRQLTLECCYNGVAHSIIRALASVEELHINDLTLLPYILRDIANSDECIYLPNMRLLQVNCCPGRLGELVKDLFYLLNVRSNASTALSSCDTVPLERLSIRVDWGDCDEPCCAAFSLRTQVGSALQAMSSWPSFSVTNVHNDQSNKQSITHARAFTAGTLIDLTFYYPIWGDEFAEENGRYHNILENRSAVVI